MFGVVKRAAALAFAITTGIFAFVPESTFLKYKILFPEKSDELNIVANRIIVLAIVFLIAYIFSLIWRFVRGKVVVKGNNYIIQIEYGDILKNENCKTVVAFDECYSTRIGDDPAGIKETSICGQFLAQYPISDMESVLANANLRPSESRSKYQGKVKYESGTLLMRGDFLLLAFAKLDESGRGHMTHNEYLDCLNLLWKEINLYYANKDVCVSILGSGITRLEDTELTKQQLLDIMIESYKLSTYKIKEPGKLRIICKRSKGFSINNIGRNI